MKKTATWLISLALLCVMCIGMFPLVSHATPGVDEKLATPTNLRWDSDARVSFDPVEGETWYEVVLKKDGVEIHRDQWSLFNPLSHRTLLGHIEGAGIYQVAVRARAANAAYNSDWATIEKTITVSTTKMPAPSELNWKKSLGRLASGWRVPAGISSYDGYEVEYYVDGSLHERLISMYRYSDYTSTIDYSYGFSTSAYHIPFPSGAQYAYFRVRNLSDDFSMYGHSDWVQSPTFDLTEPATTLPDIVSDAVNKSPDDALADLRKFSGEELLNALRIYEFQHASLSLAYTEIEKKYNAAKGIVTSIEIDDDVSDATLLPAGIKWAGLNADSGSVNVHLSKPGVAPAIDSSKYTELVAFTVDLEGRRNPQSSSLDVPIVISFKSPIPLLGSPNIVFLKINDDGTYEEYEHYTYSVTSGAVYPEISELGTYALVQRVQQTTNPEEPTDETSGGGLLGDPGKGDLAPAGGEGTATQPDEYRVLARKLNVRSGPGTGYPVLSQLRANGRVSILEVITDENGMQWGRFLLEDGTTVYASMSYMQKLTGTYTTTARLKMRSAASTKAAAVGTLPAGTEVDVKGFENGFAIADWDGKTVYLKAEYLR